MVTDGLGQASAGWYDDPHSPERMRYFDGEMWTNHFHEPGKLPDIGSWLSSTFSVFGNCWRGAAILGFIVNLAGGLVFWVGLRFVIRDVEVINENFVNFTAATGALTAVLAVWIVLSLAFGWLAMSRYFHRAHFQADPSLADAFMHALKRLPRLLVTILVFMLAASVAMTLLIGLTVVVPLIGVFLIFIAIPLVVWVVVKLAFIINAVAIAPAEMSAMRASAGVSAGRFWPVFSRLFLFTLVLGITANIASAALGQFAQIIDPDVISQILQVRNDVVIVRDFSLIDLFPSNGEFIIAIVIGSVIQAASGLISTSAFVRLYLDSGAPSEAL